jgi:hypothetical protein
MTPRLLLLASIALGLAACGGEEREPPRTAAPTPAAEEPAPTFLDDQLKAIDKAEAVEDQLIEQQQAQDQAMREQGG